MLVLSRTVGERVVIGNDIIVTVLDVQSGRVRLGIEAPRHWSIRRTELAALTHPACLEPRPAEASGDPS